MGAVVIDNHVEFPVRKFAVEVLKKIQKLLVGMALDTPRFNSAFVDQKGRHQASCPMSSIGMGEPLGFAGTQRQHRLHPVQCLNLRFLLDTENERIFRRAKIKTQDARLFLHKFRIWAFSTPVLGLVRLQGSLAKYPMYRRLRYTRGISELSCAPVAAPIIRDSTGKGHHLDFFPGGDLCRPASSRAIFQAFKALIQKAFAPFHTSLPVKADFGSDLLESLAQSCAEDNPGSVDKAVFCFSGTYPHSKGSVLILGQLNDYFFPHSAPPVRGTLYNLF